LLLYLSPKCSLSNLALVILARGLGRYDSAALLSPTVAALGLLGTIEREFLI